MRYCYFCHHMTTGEALFCNHCGRSYDAKLCPRLHANPRNSLVCSECGSTDLSIPQPKAPWWITPLIWMVTVSPGIVLLLLSLLVLVSMIEAVLTNPQVMSQLVVLTLLLGLLWLVYMQLPGFVRKAFGRGMRALLRRRRKERR